MAFSNAFRERLPDQIDIATADQLRGILASVIEEKKDTEIQIAVDHDRRGTVVLTHAIAETFLDVLRLISSGQGFQMVPYGAELTTQEAADLLNVSRPYLVKLLEAGGIPFGTVGRHRRVKASDLFAYKEARDKERAQALSDLAETDGEFL